MTPAGHFAAPSDFTKPFSAGDSPRGKSAGEQPVALLQRLGHWFLLGYIFLALSRVLDVTVSVRAAVFLLGGVVLATVFSGRMFSIFQTKVGWSLVALISWLTVTVPFSSWPGGSFESLVESGKGFVLGVAIIAIPRGIKATMQLIRAVAFAVFTAAVLTPFFGRVEYGRLMLDAGTYKDPNQFAMTLLMVMPLWIVLGGVAHRRLYRVLSYLCVIPVLVIFLRTGSRGGLLGLAVMLAIAFFQLSIPKKFVLAGSVVALGLLSLLVLPPYLRARFLTIFSASDSATENLSAEELEQLYGADIGSSYGRWALLMDSLTMTAEHPVFGVGLGQFMQQDWERRKLAGHPGHTMVTHNAYTEFSSEAGIPALVLFLFLLYQSFRTLSRLRKMGSAPRAPVEIAPAAQGMQLAFTVLAVSSFFLSVAYSQLFYIMGAITARLFLTAREMMAEAQPANAAPQLPVRPMLSTPAAPVAALALTAAPAPAVRQPRNRVSPLRSSGQNQNVRHSRLS